MGNEKFVKSLSARVGILFLVGFVFVFLKLTKQIDWSWWYVVVPFLVGFAGSFILIFLVSLFEELSSRIKRKSKFEVK